jgi:hypothetical protein
MPGGGVAGFQLAPCPSFATWNPAPSPPWESIYGGKAAFSGINFDFPLSRNGQKAAGEFWTVLLQFDQGTVHLQASHHVASVSQVADMPQPWQRSMALSGCQAPGSNRIDTPTLSARE